MTFFSDFLSWVGDGSEIHDFYNVERRSEWFWTAILPFAGSKLSIRDSLFDYPRGGNGGSFDYPRLAFWFV